MSNQRYPDEWFCMRCGKRQCISIDRGDWVEIKRIQTKPDDCQCVFKKNNQTSTISTK